MAYLKDVVEHLETVFHTHIYGRRAPRLEIHAVCFFTQQICEEPFFREHVLYLELAEHLKEDVCIFSRQEKTHDPLPLLLLGLTAADGELPFLFTEEPLELLEVLNTIQEKLLDDSFLKRKREELFLSLQNDTGIEGITHTAHTHLNNPVMICDTSFCVIASSPAVHDTRSLEEKNGKLYVKEALFQNMRRLRIIEHIRRSRLPYVTQLDDYSYQWVFESIRIRHAVAGYICVRGSVREFTEDDLEYIDVLSQMLSIEMQKDASYSQPTGLKYEYFLAELFEGRLDRREYIVQHLVQLGRCEMPYYTIILLQFQSDGRHRFHTYFDQLHTILPKCMTTLFHGELVILLPSDTQTPFPAYTKDRFLAFLQLNQMLAYISYPYTDISQSRTYYKQIKELSVWKSQKITSSDQLLIYYETWFFEQMLQQCADPRLLEASVHPDIRQMSEYDDTHHTHYTHTLRTFLDENRNAVSAAQKLHIHKSTFFYRIGKMEDLFHLDLNDSRKLFAYEYSFRLLDLTH